MADGYLKTRKRIHSGLLCRSIFDGYEGVVAVFGNHTYSVASVADTLSSVNNTFNRFQLWLGEMSTPISELKIWYNPKVREQYRHPNKHRPYFGSKFVSSK